MWLSLTLQSWPEGHNSKILYPNISLHWKYKASFYHWKYTYFKFLISEGWDGWMASLTRCTWVWVKSRSWWWTGRTGMLWFMGLQKVGHDWVIELNWTELMGRWFLCLFYSGFVGVCCTLWVCRLILYNTDFLSGSVDKKSPTNSGDMGLIRGPGRFHMPWSNETCKEQLPKAPQTKPLQWGARAFQQRLAHTHCN